MREPIYIVDGVRTPFAKAGTTLADSEAVDLGKTAFRLLVARTGIDPSKIEEVIIGCVSQPADSANVGRVVALRAGIPESVPAITVHRNCASGIRSGYSGRGKDARRTRRHLYRGRRRKHVADSFALFPRGR